MKSGFLQSFNTIVIWTFSVAPKPWIALWCNSRRALLVLWICHSPHDYRWSCWRLWNRSSGIHGRNVGKWLGSPWGNCLPLI